jgi:uncharacterized membrane protein YdjX (TVP38/TMEM64 family)
MTEAFLLWIQPLLVNHPLVAPMLFVCIHILLAVFFLPCSPMTLVAGSLWGGVYGLAISMVAGLASTATTFFLSRSVLRCKVESFFVNRYSKLAELMKKAAIHDWKLIAVSQLNPLIPSSSMGYAFGLTSITFAKYLLYSGIFMLPLQVLFVLTGHSMSTLFVSDGQFGVALLLVVATVFFILFSKRIYMKLCQMFGLDHGA